jgi:hypothetical protein
MEDCEKDAWPTYHEILNLDTNSFCAITSANCRFMEIICFDVNSGWEGPSFFESLGTLKNTMCTLFKRRMHLDNPDYTRCKRLPLQFVCWPMEERPIQTTNTCEFAKVPHSRVSTAFVMLSLKFTARSIWDSQQKTISSKSQKLMNNGASLVCLDW